MAATGTIGARPWNAQHAAGKQRAGRDRHEARRMRQQPRDHVEADQERDQQQIRPQDGGCAVGRRRFGEHRGLFLAVRGRRHRYHGGCPAFHPFGDDCGERVEPVGQRRRAGLQDQRRFDLAQEAVGDGGNRGEAGPGGDLGGHEFLAAPGADDDVGPRRRSRRRPETMRSLAFLRAASCGNTSMPPAASISSDTQPRPEIIGSSHSSK